MTVEEPSSAPPLLGGLRREGDLAARHKAQGLAEMLPVDHFVRLRFPFSRKKALKESWPKLSSTLAKGLEEKAVLGPLKWIKSSKAASEAMLPIRRTSEESNASSVLLGPPAGSAGEAAQFRRFWGESACQLRRLEDGAVRESVSISNPWGAERMAVAVVAHLAEKEGVQATPILLTEDLLPRHLQTRDDLRHVRQALSDLSSLLVSHADDDLPLRRARGLGPAVHSGVGAANCAPPQSTPALHNKKKGGGGGGGGGNSVVVKPSGGCFLLKAKATIAPARVDAIPVTLDVTHKKHLSAELFKHLKTAYLLSLKKTLDSQRLPTALKDRKLYVIFRGLVFSLDVDPPEDPGSDESVPDWSGLQNHLQTLGLRHPAWAGAFHVVRKWLSAKMLLSSPGVHELSELILASIFERPLQGLQPPLSVEGAVLRFLDLLSFHDFSVAPLAVGDVDQARLASTEAAMRVRRDTLPAFVAVTQFDGGQQSPFTRKIALTDRRRMVNLARQSLHSLVSSSELSLDWSAFEAGLQCHLDTYDIVVHLKPLQIPHQRKRKHSSESEMASTSAAPFPVVDFDPAARYLSELRESFSGLADFYHGGPEGAPVVGVRLAREAREQTERESIRQSSGHFVHAGRLLPNVDAMVEDLRVMGQGIVKDVKVSIKS